MPIIKSAAKRVRTSEKARQRNKSIRSLITSARRKTFAAFNLNDAPSATAAFRAYCSVLDKAAKKGIIGKNTSIRRKRRAAARLSALLSHGAKPASSAPAQAEKPDA